LQHRQNAADVQRRVHHLHPADLAFVLEALPRRDRLTLWRDIDDAHAAEALVEIDQAVREGLLAATPHARQVAILAHLDVDDLAWLSESLAPDVLRQVTRSLDELEQTLLRQTTGYAEGSVGHLMSHEVVAVQEAHTASEVIADLRQRASLPPHADPVFVVDRRNVLRGAVSLQALLLSPPDVPVAAVMDPGVRAFAPDDPATLAARAFDRYNLVSAPVTTERGKLVGRLTVDAIIDFVQEAADRDALSMAGLRGAEDLFAPMWRSTRNRTPWLFVNLVTAFAATRFIGLFESTISGLVALATLMPIVASIGGNTGNQTVALVIRGLAFDQINDGNIRRVLRKELLIGLMNGVLWGGLVGLAALALYGRPRLSVVLAAAVLLNLGVAAIAGVAVPVWLQRLGRDPAQGSSVLLTFVTDSMGFFLFLGLAHLLL
ncbi:MAG: magnesium transporter, partial [Vicinamibacterales bacterium]